MALNVKSFILYSTLLSIFSEAALVHHGIDIKLVYLVIMLNTLLLMAQQPLVASNKHLIVLCILAVSGYIGVVLGTNRWQPFLFAIVGISISSIYYYNFFRYCNSSVERLFALYARFSTWVAFIGLLLFCYFFFLEGNPDYRIKSIMLEPAHFATVAMPALYYYMTKMVQQRRCIWSGGILLTAVILSDSAVGYVGLVLIFLFFTRRGAVGVLTGIIAASLFVGAVYATSEGFRLRVDDTLQAVQKRAVSGVNLSTFSLVKNALIAIESVKRNPLFGSGLGSHVVSHDAFIDAVPGSDQVRRIYPELVDLNAKDAGSLASRILSEVGLIGAISFTAFLLYFREKRNPLNTAVLIYVLLKLLRDGHYFSPEVYFFLMVYVSTGALGRRTRRPQAGLNYLAFGPPASIPVSRNGVGEENTRAKIQSASLSAPSFSV